MIRRPQSRRARIAAALLTVAGGSLFLQAAASQEPVEAFLGTWSGVFTTQSHEYWIAADIGCFVGCPLEMYNQLVDLLDDPLNDEFPIAALAGQASAAWLMAFSATLTPEGQAVMAGNRPEDDPKFLNCQPYGFVREVTNPLPMRIVRDGGNLVVLYEEWSLLRPIYMDGRAHPESRTPSLLGHSVGRVEDGVLIVETTGILPDRVSDASQIGHSGELTATERYTVHEDPKRLELTLTLEDAVMFTEPLVITKTWLATPDVELVQDTCFQQPGKPL